MRANDKAASRTWKTCPRLAIKDKSDQKSFSAFWRSPRISSMLELSGEVASPTIPRGRESTVGYIVENRAAPNFAQTTHQILPRKKGTYPP
jgi:hypothetical protein